MVVSLNQLQLQPNTKRKLLRTERQVHMTPKIFRYDQNDFSYQRCQMERSKTSNTHMQSIESTYIWLKERPKMSLTRLYRLQPVKYTNITATQNRQPKPNTTRLNTPEDERDKNANAQDNVDSEVRIHANQVRSFAKCALIRSNFSSSPRKAVVVFDVSFWISLEIALLFLSSTMYRDKLGRY